MKVPIKNKSHPNYVHMFRKILLARSSVGFGCISPQKRSRESTFCLLGEVNYIVTFFNNFSFEMSFEK